MCVFILRLPLHYVTERISKTEDIDGEKMVAKNPVRIVWDNSYEAN